MGGVSVSEAAVGAIAKACDDLAGHLDKIGGDVDKIGSASTSGFGASPDGKKLEQRLHEYATTGCNADGLKASATEQKKTVQSYKDQLQKGYKQIQEQDQLAAKGISSTEAGAAGNAGDYSSGHGAAAGKGREAAKAWIEKGLAAKGIPKKDWPAWENGLLTMMERESSFNPGAVNNWDSNAQAGHASVGVLQMIPSTFNSYKVAGLDDIMDPSAQVASCVGYVMSRYNVSADGSNLTALVQQADRNRPPKGY